MRSLLSSFVSKNDYFLHADMWNVDRFPVDSIVINSGLGESNLLNISGGLASQGNTVYVYGVAGFIIHRLEQLKFSCKHFGANNGKIIIVNAGIVGYGDMGIGHKLDDDEAIMSMLDIPFMVPKDLNDFENMLHYLKQQKNGIWYIQLGKDYER